VVGIASICKIDLGNGNLRVSGKNSANEPKNNVSTQ
jgi:hypothetical protein